MLVLRPGELDVQHRDAQVTVVLQRQRDDLLQMRIGEEIPPADVRGMREIDCPGVGPGVRRRSVGWATDPVPAAAGRGSAARACSPPAGSRRPARRNAGGARPHLTMPLGARLMGRLPSCAGEDKDDGADGAGAAGSGASRRLWNTRCTTTKNSGMKKMPRKVPASMPPNTPVPIACCAPAPAPVAIASGSTPRPNASEVIRIGRSRSRTACSVASITPRPLSTIFLGELDDQDRVLAREPDGRQHGDLEVDVALQAAQRRREHRTDHTQRHRQDDRGGNRPALVQRGQAQEHHDQRQAVEQRQSARPRRAPGRTRRSSRPSSPAAAWLTSFSISCIASPELTPGRGLTVDLHRRYAVVALQPRRAVFPVAS